MENLKIFLLFSGHLRALRGVGKGGEGLASIIHYTTSRRLYQTGWKNKENVGIIILKNITFSSVPVLHCQHVSAHTISGFKQTPFPRLIHPKYSLPFFFLFSFSERSLVYILIVSPPSEVYESGQPLPVRVYQIRELRAWILPGTTVPFFVFPLFLLVFQACLRRYSILFYLFLLWYYLYQQHTKLPSFSSDKRENWKEEPPPSQREKKCRVLRPAKYTNLSLKQWLMK